MLNKKCQHDIVYGSILYLPSLERLPQLLVNNINEVALFVVNININAKMYSNTLKQEIDTKSQTCIKT